MKLLNIILAILFLVSHHAAAENVKTIRVFYSDSVGIKQDMRIPKGVSVYYHNMDSMEHSEKKLTSILKNKVASSKNKASVQETYTQAFSEVLNGSSWPSHYQDIIASTEAQEKAVRYGIKKIPAILFNEKSIVYGVPSLTEAVNIFNNRGDKR